MDTDFYFEEWSLQQFVVGLIEMEGMLRGKAILKPMWEDNFLQFEMESLGRVIVTGEFTQHAEHEQKLKFGFLTDQTCLAPFIADLSSLSKQ